MKKFTQAEFDAIERNSDGIKEYPIGDYSLIKTSGNRCSFGEQCSFGEWCSFENIGVLNRAILLQLGSAQGHVPVAKPIFTTSKKASTFAAGVS